MGNELIRVGANDVEVSDSHAALSLLVERAGAAGRFAWDEFFYAEHHNSHTQAAYLD
jgi:integrase/recombinase XerD